MRAALAFAITFVPVVVLAASPRNFRELAEQLIEYMNAITQLLVIATVVVYLGGVAHILYKSSGGSKSAEMNKFLAIGIGIIFVMVSIWGILEILSNTIASGGGGSYGPSKEEQFCYDAVGCLE